MASIAQRAALVAAILASGGGAAFLTHHHNPTLADVFLGCEQGKLQGVICCEDMNRVIDIAEPLKSCGAVTPQNHDPFGTRKQEETDWDNAK